MAAEEFLASVEPGIRQGLLSDTWLQGKKRITVSRKVLETAKPTMKFLVTESLIVQLDALAHQTFNDLRSGEDQWFEIDVFDRLSGHKVPDGHPYLVAKSERFRDLLLLAFVRNTFVHGKSSGESRLPLVRPDRVKGLMNKVFPLNKGQPFRWSQSDGQKKSIESAADAVDWYMAEAFSIVQNPSYDHYFRFSWAVKTILNAAVDPSKAK